MFPETLLIQSRHFSVTFLIFTKFSKVPQIRDISFWISVKFAKRIELQNLSCSIFSRLKDIREKTN